MPSLPSAKDLWDRWRSAVAADLKQVSWRAVAINIAAIMVSAAVLLGLFLVGLNTPPGRRLLVQFATGIKLNSGLQIEIGEIDGSLYGDMTLYDVRVLDTKGAFITSPLVHLDWRPFGYLNKHVDIRDLSTPRIDVLRQPVFNPEQNPEKGGPLLPDLKIDVNRLQVDTLALHAGVFGDARNAMIQGSAHIAHGRAQIDATTLSDKGDEVIAALDAEPDNNKLALDAHLKAPTGGIVAGLLDLKKPLDADVSGKGSWTDWTGRAQAQLGSDSLLDLGVTAQSGKVHVLGDTRPDLLIGGSDLLTPAVHIDATGIAKDRKVDLVAALSTEALKLDTKGRIDLGGNSFDHLEAHLRLLDPKRLDSDFTGNDLHADLMFDGAFQDWKVDYDLAATRFGIGDIKLAGLDAKGKSHRDGDRVIVPLNGTLTAMSGIDSHVDPLLTHVRLTGDIALVGLSFTTQNLRLKTDRLQATATAQGDLGTADFTSNIKATLNDYAVDNVGVVNLASSARMARKNGRFLLDGTATAQSTHLSDGLKSFLGGNAKLSGTYTLAANGAFSLHKLAGTAPQFTLASGDATFGPGSALKVTAAGTSQQYGPLEAVLSGTFDAPQAVVKAARPGFGVGINNVVANLSGTPAGYAVTAMGGSDYGPFSADTIVHLDKGPLSIDIHRAEFAGIAASGTITQSQAGPFSGQLVLSGSGLNGTATLSEVGGNQGAAISATGGNITLPGNLGVHVGRTIISANAVLAKELDLDADVQLADATYGGVTVATGRAKVHMHGERGTVQAVATGARDVPFDVAVNGDIAPDAYTFAAKGTVNSVALGLDHPARVSRQGTDWVLSPVTVVMDGGKIDLAGRFGQAMTMQARLDDVDLSVANLFRNDLGITGKANGQVDFRQAGGGFPTARAALQIDGFSRASAAVVSTPVDIAMEGQLDPSLQPSANYLHAIVRQGGVVVGRAQLALSPAASGVWTDRILDAGVSGGVRYNGPAGVPFSLAGQARQQLSGPVALAADVSGHLNAPQLNGVVKADSLTYDNDNLGTRISALALDGRFTNDRLELTSFSGRAGNGTVKGNGWLSLAANQHFPLMLHVDLDNARLAHSDAIDSTVSGTLDISNNQKDGALIAGDLRLPQLKYTVTRQGAAEVNVLDGVHHKGYDVEQATDNGLAPPSLWKLDIKASAANQIFVSGMGLESEWRMNLHLVGTTQDPQVLGEMRAIRGTYAFAGRDFTINDGVITFDGGALTDPQIQLSASANVNDITGVINVSGSAQKPSIAFTSTPALPQDEVLSRILFGESVTNLSATEALQLASAVNGLSGGTDYLNPLGALRSATGIDRLRVIGADATTGRGTSLAAGKYVTNNVYVEVVTDTKGFTGTQVEVALSHTLSVLSQTGSSAGTSVSLKYSRDY